MGLFTHTNIVTESDIIKKTTNMRGPSKKIIFVMFACIIAIGGIYLASKTESRQVFIATDTAKLLPEIFVNDDIKNTSDIDTDGDGLKDWEEVLWKTNPLKADTDGNAIPDDKEIATKQLQNSQQMVAILGVKNTEKSTLPENLTITDKLAMETFAQYINYKQTGVPITPEYTQKLIENVFGNATKNQNITKFSSRNLTNVVDSENESVIRAYGNNFWDIVVKNTPKDTPLQNEYVILLTAIQNDDENELKKLDPIVNGYTKIINEMLTMQIPRSAIEEHLDILNNMNSVLALIEDMRVYFTDPARGFRAVVYYKDIVPGLEKSIKKLVSYFEEKNIEYVEEESGYSLTHSI